jgi:IS30 family transposase
LLIKYREILRFHAQDLSNRGIASSCGCSKNTVGVVLKRAEELEVAWPLEKEMSDSEL